MIPVEFDKRLVTPEVYKYQTGSYIPEAIWYFIHSDYRKAVNLVAWIKEQVDNPSETVLGVAKAIKSYKSHDAQMLEILRWVKKNIRYEFDSKVWEMREYWATAEETLIKKKGDCDDGALLMYVMARLKDVPEYKLLIFGGDVFVPRSDKLGGHCWLGYRSETYPLNWTFMDWCYYYDSKHPSTRTKYYIQKTKIYGDEKYKNIWFGFNEAVGHKSLVNTYGNS